MAHEDKVNHSYANSNANVVFSIWKNRHACDRKKPNCTPCGSRGLECVYPEAAPTLKELEMQAEKLAARIQGLEKSKRTSVFSEWPSRLIRHTALYPCQKCNQLQQPCDMRKPSCDRCKSYKIDCSYIDSERPKVYHISHAIAAMNNVIDAYELAFKQDNHQRILKTPSLSSPFLSTRKSIWTVASTPQGFTAYAHVSSYRELQMLINHIHENQPMENHIVQRLGDSTHQYIAGSRPSDKHNNDNKAARTAEAEAAAAAAAEAAEAARPDYLLAFALWDEYTFNAQSLPHDYPIDVTSDLTDDLLALYCRTPCCSAARLPIIDTKEFMARHRNPDIGKRPSKVLTYAICAMAARNAFQVHVWSKGHSHASPRYNMGKALSVGYWLAARKLLAECFDEPSLDNCRSALLLSYASHQNGHTGTMYYYDWIAITMAKELGLFEDSHHDYYDKMLAWSLYYWNVWMRVLCGGTAHVTCPQPSYSPPSPPININDDHYDVLSAWSLNFHLQAQRATIMASLVSAQDKDLNLPQLVELLQPQQEQLETFFRNLPDEWKSMEIKPYQEQKQDDHLQEMMGTVDRGKLRCVCAFDVMVNYFINVIMVHFPFLQSRMDSNMAHAEHCLRICMHAAQSITRAIEATPDCCYTPVIGLAFSNGVYNKIFQCTGSDWALQRMQQSVDILKPSLQYVYDFDTTKSLARTMENGIQMAMNIGCHKQQ
ncbi:hypothetical protein BX666DRAFT_2023145 [Dichotomocladium elegans]|nr:hypothetical protein BX666DRAFT_2023145 [Dichotomocladium elegans]